MSCSTGFQRRFRRRSGRLWSRLRCFQRLASQHAAEIFVKISRCGCWGYRWSLFLLDAGTCRSTGNSTRHITKTSGSWSPFLRKFCSRDFKRCKQVKTVKAVQNGIFLRLAVGTAQGWSFMGFQLRKRCYEARLVPSSTCCPILLADDIVWKM